MFFVRDKLLNSDAIMALLQDSVEIVPLTEPVKPESLPTNMFKLMALFPLTKEPIEADQLYQQLAKQASTELREVFVGTGPSINDVHYKDVLPEMTLSDKRLWTPTLGKKGFMSIVKSKANTYESDYYLVLCADNAQLSEDIHAIASRKNVKPNGKLYTMQNLLESKEYHAATHLANRNIQRVAVQISNALGISIVTDKLIDHFSIPTVSSDGSFVRPSCYKPIASTMFNYLDRVNHSSSAQRCSVAKIACYKSCSNASDSFGGPLIPLNPVDGFVWLKQLPAAALTNHRFTEETVKLIPLRAKKAPGSFTKERRLFAQKSVLFSLEHPDLACAYPTIDTQLGEIQKNFFNTKTIHLQPVVTTLL